MNVSEAAKAFESLSNNLADLAERAGRSVVAVNARPRTPSSGVYWKEGIVLTASHTVERQAEITVTAAEGQTVQATLAGRDPSTDLAALKVEGLKLPVPEFADASRLRAGHLVLALGRGEAGHHWPRAALGVVNAAGGPWRTWRGGEIDRLVRVDVGIFLGFSGGALIDSAGRVAGINTTGLVRRGAVAVTPSTVSRVTEELVQKGHITRAYLGVGMQPVRLPASLASKLGLTQEVAMLAVSVEPGSPADRAGVMLGDVLVALGETPVRSFDDVQTQLGRERIGTALAASFIRAGSPVKLSLIPAERPGGGAC